MDSRPAYRAAFRLDHRAEKWKRAVQELELARDVALAAALDANAYIVQRQATRQEASSKDGHVLNLVTESDVAVEKAIIARLGAAFPNDAILGEESGDLATPSTAGRRRWVIDPICGTRNFAFGLPAIATNIALLIDEVPVLGVVAVSPSGPESVLWAIRGQGTFARLADGSDRSVQVNPDSQIVNVDIGYALMSGRSAPIAALLALLVAEARFPVRTIGSSATLPFQARGGIAANLFQQSKPWDIIAGCLLCEEAGAIVTDFAGASWQPFGSSFLTASSREIHAYLLDLLARSTMLVPTLAQYAPSVPA